jgi:hypothetical protein
LKATFKATADMSGHFLFSIDTVDLGLLWRRDKQFDDN